MHSVCPGVDSFSKILRQAIMNAEGKMHENKDDSKQDNQREKKGKKPYIPPAWEVEEVFERHALSCQKADARCGDGFVIVTS